jgi:nitroreductase
MEKSANVQHSIHSLLSRRWSPMAFSSRDVEPWKLSSVLEAARWAPSSYNDQPWSFIVATQGDPDPFKRMVECLEEANAEWASNAPVLILSVARLRFELTGVVNRHAFHDVGLAIANLVVQSTVLSLSVHQMAGFDTGHAIEAFGIPADHEPVVIFAVGYPGDPRSLSEPLRRRESAPRTRKPMDQFVFSGQWGQPSELAMGRGRRLGR